MIKNHVFSWYIHEKLYELSIKYLIKYNEINYDKYNGSSADFWRGNEIPTKMHKACLIYLKQDITCGELSLEKMWVRLTCLNQVWSN